MRARGWRGTSRGPPGPLQLADFTYVPLACGFGYTAFVIDAFAGLIPGWECSLSKRAAFVESAIRQAAGFRVRQGYPLAGGTIHHSDAGSPSTPPCISPRHSCWPGCSPRSAPSEIAC
jgi:transposase InsO family protein